MVKDDSQRKILKWIELNAKEDTVHKMWLDPDKPLWRWKQMALDASAIQKKKGLKINSLKNIAILSQYLKNKWTDNALESNGVYSRNTSLVQYLKIISVICCY